VLGRDQALELLERTLSWCPADQAEVVIQAGSSQLTRFAQSAIHQNVAERNAEVRVRAVIGKRIGCASTNRLDDQRLHETAEAAARIARVQPENPDFRGLPGPGPINEFDAFVPATADCGPERRAEIIKDLAARCRAAACVISGSLATSAAEVAVGNSLGTRVYHPVTDCAIVTLAADGDATGYTESSSRDIDALPCADTVERAIRKCHDSRRAEPVEPGEYEVVLEPLAVADLVMGLAWLGMSALAVQEGRSFMCDRMGERVMSESVSIWDDGHDTRTHMAMPFDFEGVPKQRVNLIEGGVARAVVYDSYTAGRDGVVSTGHALPAPNPGGPVPWNLVLAPGNSSREEMIADIKRGLLVTRFHYVNVIHPRETVITGMTRDGTWLIENGGLVRPVRNLRFTQSIVEALSGVVALGREAVPARPYDDATVCVPAARLARFAFTS
jgi:PmbA protein